MYELKNGSKRLINALSCTDDRAIAILSNVLHYTRSQLKEDIQALGDLLKAYNDSVEDIQDDYLDNDDPVEDENNNNIDSDPGYSITIPLTTTEYVFLDSLCCYHDVRISHVLGQFINDLIQYGLTSGSYGRSLIIKWFENFLRVSLMDSYQAPDREDQEIDKENDFYSVGLLG